EAHVAARARAQDGPQLGLERLGIPEAHADGPPAHVRIALVSGLQPGDLLVAARVERADGDRAGGERLGERPVGPALLLFSRPLLPAQEGELGAVQAHAARAVPQQGRGLLGALEVGGGRDVLAVAGDGLEAAQALEVARPREPRGAAVLML